MTTTGVKKIHRIALGLAAAAAAAALLAASARLFMTPSGPRPETGLPATAPEAYYLKEAFTYRNLPHPPDGHFKTGDVLLLAGLLNKERLLLLARERAASGGQTRLAQVRPGPMLPKAKRIPIDLARPELTLGRAPAFYSYEIINRGSRTTTGPVIYGKYLWNSVPNLMRTSGFTAIPGELDRALAIHRFLLDYHRHDSHPRGGGGEYDIIRYLTNYGYGLCDDAAGLQAALLRLAGLDSRVWSLSGHVVAEVRAGSKWRLLDPDNRVYFHPRGAPTEIYGVEDLAADRTRFDHYVSDFWPPGGRYPEIAQDIVLSTSDNHVSYDLAYSSAGTIAYDLRPGERIVFTNFNWGRHYAAAFHPTPFARYYNGFMEFRPGISDLRAAGLAVSQKDGKMRLVNGSRTPAFAELRLAAPFTVAGGEIIAEAAEKDGDAYFQIIAPGGVRAMSCRLRPGGNACGWENPLDAAGNAPFMEYTLAVKLQPGAKVSLSGFSVRTDFQYGRLALAELKAGTNRLLTYFPPGAEPATFESAFYVGD